MSNAAPQDPHDPHPRIRQFAKDAAEEQFFASLNLALAAAPLSPGPAIPVDVSRLPIIYICGVPRSGTTLLSQLLSRHLPVGYIDNVVARFWLRPRVGVRLSRSLLRQSDRQSVAFDSRHGVTQDIFGPHEFGYFWRHWLALDEAPTHKLGEAAARALDLKGLQRALQDELLAEFASPMVFKNVICGFQAAVLARVHPFSLFVWIRRDAEDVVRSILKCRMERYGDYKAWWSLKPSSYPALARLDSPVQQVMGQVMDCAGELERELSKPGIRSLTVEYSDLVNNPGALLGEVCRALRVFDREMMPLPSPPPVFHPPPRVSLPAHLEAELAALFGAA